MNTITKAQMEVNAVANAKKIKEYEKLVEDERAMETYHEEKLEESRADLKEFRSELRKLKKGK